MGYTHYFPRLAASTDIISDARKIIDGSAVTICGPAGQGQPILNKEDGIRLNGFEAAGESYETFHLRGTKAPPGSHTPSLCRQIGRQHRDAQKTIPLNGERPTKTDDPDL